MACLSHSSVVSWRYTGDAVADHELRKTTDRAVADVCGNGSTSYDSDKVGVSDLIRRALLRIHARRGPPTLEARCRRCNTNPIPHRVVKAKKRSWGHRRTKIVSVRLSEDEARQVQAGARASTLSLSAFIRETALHSAAGRRFLGTTFERRLCHQLRRAHTVLQKALVHAGTQAGHDEVHRAARLIHETIVLLRPRGGSRL